MTDQQHDAAPSPGAEEPTAPDITADATTPDAPNTQAAPNTQVAHGGHEGGDQDSPQANTTDELPKPPAVGPVEVIEPEAHRVPHPPVFAHNGDSHLHDHGAEGEAGAGSVIDQLSALIADRAASPRKGSYTNSLLADPIKAQRKMMEEAFETCLELHTPTALVDHEAVAAEAADLVFHLLVALRTQGLGWAEVEAKLVDRLGKPARHSTY